MDHFRYLHRFIHRRPLDGERDCLLCAVLCVVMHNVEWCMVWNRMCMIYDVCVMVPRIYFITISLERKLSILVSK